MKSKEEQRFEELSEKYFDMFGQNYPLDITNTASWDVHFKAMEKAIETETPVKVEHDPDLIY